MIKYKKNNGITIIALVITIVVILILVTVTISAFFANSGVVNKTTDSSFASDISRFKEELELFISSKKVETHGTYDKSSLYAQNIHTEENGVLPIITVIPSMSNQYYLDRISIQSGEFNFFNFTENEFNIINQLINQSKVPEDFKKQAGVNPPIIPNETFSLSTSLTDGICGVTFSSSGEVEIYSDFSQEWYDYKEQNSSTENGGDSKWANIQTKDGSLWVWIPRFAYRITNFHTADAGKVEIKFLKDTSNEFYDGTGFAQSNPENITYSQGSQNEWFVPPAFNFNNTNLSGFWIAKYEASAKEGFDNPATGDASFTAKNILNEKTIQIKANCEPWNYIDFENSFGNCYYMGRNNFNVYGFKPSTNTHLIKNSEWAAASFLAQSSYGRNGTEISCNTSLLTDDNGILTSTTGNYYGVFDMVGCTADTVSAFSEFANIDISKFIPDTSLALSYYDVYPSYNNTSTIKGDAIWETSKSNNSNNSWFNIVSWFVQNIENSETRMTRGGNYIKAKAGIFGFDRFKPVWYQVSNVGFRPSITL